MEFYTAGKVFSPAGKLVVDGLLVMEGQTVVDFIDPSIVSDGLPEASRVLRKNGILSPGFINAHCHLELSGLKGLVQAGTGLVGFIKDLQRIRSREESLMMEAAAEQDQRMFDYGIQVVGDICNSNLTIPVKRASKINYHSFVELFSFRPEQASITLQKGKLLLEQFSDLTNANGVSLSAGLTPHAPYSTSVALMKLISQELNGLPCSIHMMESVAEFEFLMNAQGDFMDMMQVFGIAVDDLVPYADNPFRLFLTHFRGKGPLISVHNSYLDLVQEDLIRNKMSGDVFYCLCPRANQYIERVYPPLDLLRSLNRKIVLGTDSLASNHDLNLLNEVKSLLSLENIPEEEWLMWITINGANALGLEAHYGSFSKGKKPGLIHIKNDLTVDRIL